MAKSDPDDKKHDHHGGGHSHHGDGDKDKGDKGDKKDKGETKDKKDKGGWFSSDQNLYRSCGIGGWFKCPASKSFLAQNCPIDINYGKNGKLDRKNSLTFSCDADKVVTYDATNMEILCCPPDVSKDELKQCTSATGTKILSKK